MSPRARSLDFDLLVETDGLDHWARVLGSPAGQGSTRFDVPFAPGELDRSLFRVTSVPARMTRGAPQREAEARDIGTRLFDTVFSDEVGKLYALSTHVADEQDVSLRLLIRTPDPEMSAWPWELLYDAKRARFLALSSRTPVLRFVPSPQEAAVPEMGDELSVLVVMPSPVDTPPVNIETQFHHLLGAVTASARISLSRLEHATLLDLQRALLTAPDVVQFSGYARVDPAIDEASVLFEREDGTAHPVQMRRLATLLSDAQRLRLVVLDASASTGAGPCAPGPALAEILVRGGVPAAIGMQFAVTDQSMPPFLNGFYTAMASGLSVDTAIGEARKAMVAGQGRDAVEWASPVLYTRVRHERPTPGRVVDADVDFPLLLSRRTIEQIASLQLGEPQPELAASAPLLRTRFATVTENARAALAQEGATFQRDALGRVADDLNLLARQLNREGRVNPGTSSSAYQESARQWGEVAVAWLAVLRAKIDDLDVRIEHDQEVASPYRAGLPLKRDAPTFVGRSDIAARLERLIMADGTPPLLLYGQRRMGKTSLLYNVGRMLPRSVLPLLVDLQGPTSRTDSTSGFLFQLANDMARSAGGELSAVLRPPPREAFSRDAFSQFHTWLDDLDGYAEGRTILLMLDEFEALQRAFDAGRIDPDDVLGMLRSLIQHRTRFTFLLAGSHTLQLFEKWSSYLINVQVLKVGYLTDQEARKLIERPVPDFVLTYDSAATNRVIELTRGHPYLIQLLCSEVIAFKNERPPAQRRWATAADVEASVPAALENGLMFFTDIEQGQIDGRARTVLRIMSRAGEGTPTPERMLEDAVDGYLRETLSLLREREIIEPFEGGHRFQVELIRRWFAQEQ